ncbi:MAG: phosphatidylserine/phosphatidylglycerophosphate/cardiolipin synthase family protein [Planctomycetes bacterium]|nr:phosphatidylserine/phosphatidylglycerophosphate/cardiolipin synthase family protein [Planctomycetota bacterium]
MPSGVFRAPYPFAAASPLEFLAEPRETWARLLADLASARRSLLVENFIFNDGLAGAAVVDALVRAADNGAQVRVHADGFGASGFGAEPSARLAAAGVELRFFNRLGFWKMMRPVRAFPRTHRRIVVVDDLVGWTGGLAFDDQWWPEEGREAARDTMARFEGEAVRHLADAFERLWHKGGAGGPPMRRQAAGEHGEIRVVPQYTLRAPHYHRTMIRRLHHAKRRAWIAVPYFFPGPSLYNAMRRALHRGVDLRFLFPGKRTDHPAVRLAARRHYGRLLRGGARIWEYQPSFMHAKVALFDDEWALTGSSNLDAWSLFINNEIAVECCDAPAVASLRRQFQADFARSREVTLDDWRRRGLWARFLERFVGTFDPAF